MNKKAQAPVEYMILLGLIAFIVLFAFKVMLPKVQLSSKETYESVTRGIMGDNPAPIDGVWCDWVPKHIDPDNCSFTAQRRDCACPAPAFGGKYCPKDGDGAIRKVKGLDCPVDGGWCPWGSCKGGPCDGKGFQTRDCNCPSPSGGGVSCKGATAPVTVGGVVVDKRLCTMPACPVAPRSCNWKWSDCSEECGGGTQSRTCECPLFFTGLPDCPSAGTDTRKCNTHSCSSSTNNGVCEPFEFCETQDCTLTARCTKNCAEGQASPGVEGTSFEYCDGSDLTGDPFQTPLFSIVEDAASCTGAVCQVYCKSGYKKELQKADPNKPEQTDFDACVLDVPSGGGKPGS